jgi:U3 small nucleolar ribonucleoprotein protein IMP3
MVRKLKFHEQKLLKRVDFLNWKNERNFHEVTIMRKFFIQKREDYVFYNRLCGKIQKLAGALKKLDKSDSFRIKMTDDLLEKLCLISFFLINFPLVTMPVL